jgi:hypothetical protein
MAVSTLDLISLEMVRPSLLDLPSTPDYRADWKSSFTRP